MSLELVQSAAQAARLRARVDDIFDDIYSKHLSEDERYMLLWLAAAGRPLTAEAVAQAGARRSGAAKQLRKRHYVAQREDGTYTMRIGIMSDWMLYGWAMYEQEIERLRVPGALAASTAGAAQSQHRPAVIPSQGLCIDMATQRIYIDGRELTDNVSNLEYRALIYLAARAGQVVSKEELAEHVWQTTYYEEDDQRISALIYRLRDALHDKQTPYAHLETLRKRGFRLKRAMLLPAGLPSGAKG
jgi:DNA-binding response OmpR family regulator